MWTAIFTFLAAVSGLIAWWVKRKRAPTRAERIDDLKSEYNETLDNVARLRRLGKHAEAENLMERIRNRAVLDRLRNIKADSSLFSEAERERMDDDIASRKRNYGER